MICKNEAIEKADWTILERRKLTRTRNYSANQYFPVCILYNVKKYSFCFFGCSAKVSILAFSTRCVSLFLSSSIALGANNKELRFFFTDSLFLSTTNNVCTCRYQFSISFQFTSILSIVSVKRVNVWWFRQIWKYKKSFRFFLNAMMNHLWSHRIICALCICTQNVRFRAQKSRRRWHVAKW